MYIDDLFIKEVENEDELLKEFDRQKVGQESCSNWYSASWSETNIIYLEGQLKSLIVLTTEEEKNEYFKKIKNIDNDILNEKPNFIIIKRHYIQDSWGDQESRDELSYYIIYVKGYLNVALHFLINRIISPVYYAKINVKNRIIKSLKKQLQK